jgi:hypothetical protein
MSDFIAGWNKGLQGISETGNALRLALGLPPAG